MIPALTLLIIVLIVYCSIGVHDKAIGLAVLDYTYRYKLYTVVLKLGDQERIGENKGLHQRPNSISDYFVMGVINHTALYRG